MALSKETIADIKREVNEMEARLRQLLAWNGDANGNPYMTPAEGAEVLRPLAQAAVESQKKPRKPRVSAEVKASRALQGQYLALARQFSTFNRAKFGKVAKEKGREKAIREMRAALKARVVKTKAPRKATATE